jgi:hypothetical protein
MNTHKIPIHKGTDYRKAIRALNPQQRKAFETALSNPAAVKTNDVATLMKRGLVRREGTRLTVPEYIRRVYGSMLEENDMEQDRRL